MYFRCRTFLLGFIFFLIFFFVIRKPRDSSLSVNLHHQEDDPFLYTETTPGSPLPPFTFSSTRIKHLQIDFKRIFRGSKSRLSGQWTTAQGSDDILKIVFLGVDEGDPEKHLLCDKYHAARLPKVHGQFPRVLEVKRQRDREWSVSIGEDISRVGKFVLCVYTEDPKDMVGWQPFGQDIAIPGEDGEKSKARKGRYLYTGLNMEINWPEHIGLHMITSLYDSGDKERLQELYHCISEALNNPYIAEVHFLQEEDDYSIFPDWILHSKKFKYIAVGRRMTYAMAWEYGRRYLDSRRILLANSDIFFDDSLLQFQYLPTSVFDTHLFVLTRHSTHSNGTLSTDLHNRGSYDSFIFVPGFLGQGESHLWPKPGPKEPVPESIRPPRKLIEKIDFPLGVDGSENRFLYEVQQWYPDVVFRNPALLVRSWHRRRNGAGSSDPDSRLDRDGKSVNNIEVMDFLVEDQFWDEDRAKRRREIERREKEQRGSWW